VWGGEECVVTLSNTQSRKLVSRRELAGLTLAYHLRASPAGTSANLPERGGELNGSLQHIYSERLDKGWCVCRDQDLLDFPLSKGLRHGVVGSPAMA
jgi:hypothetical protein